MLNWTQYLVYNYRATVGVIIELWVLAVKGSTKWAVKINGVTVKEAGRDQFWPSVEDAQRAAEDLAKTRVEEAAKVLGAESITWKRRG
jgi:hypothetical protein